MLPAYVEVGLAGNLLSSHQGNDGRATIPIWMRLKAIASVACVLVDSPQFAMDLRRSLLLEHAGESPEVHEDVLLLGLGFAKELLVAN